MLAGNRISVEAIEAREAMTAGKTLVDGLEHGGLRIALIRHKADTWLTFARGKDGGVALRTHLLASDTELSAAKGEDGALLAWEAKNALGMFRGELSGEPTGLEQFRYRITFEPRRAVHVPYLPRDLIPFGRNGDPLSTEGKVEASQRGLNTGLCYVDLKRPKLGKLLYLQDLTALNAYFRATETTPEDAVGGDWPILGYLPPTQPGDAGKTVPARATVLYDTRLVFRQMADEDESDSAWQFLDMLGTIYRDIGKPKTERRDWTGRSERTLRDLETAHSVRQRHYGHVYFRPYPGAEYPDSMAQLSLASAIHDWGEWSGEKHPLGAEIRRGLEKFYDKELETVRRFLPDVGEDKNANEVDSWYLYHPLLNLANLALGGDEAATDLFLRSIDYGIKAARHFDYCWPIQFDVRDFTVLTPVAPADERGQTDVGGIYAWLMLQAFELTGEARFIDEAKAALEKARGMRFDLNYQANLTAWGAAACIRLWRITNRKTYLALSYVYLASFFHNSQMWESEIGHARHYSNFLGVTCLEDAPYMACYECFDSYAAFERYLDLGGPDLIPAARLLVTEFCRYALHRAWFYYPDALPADAISEEVRSGEIDRELSFPLEDLYPDGQPAGQVGQEVYGAGAAMIFATRAFHRIDGAPFIVFCDHFLRAMTRLDGSTLSVKIDGEDGQLAEFALLRVGRKRLPAAIVRTLAGKTIEPASASDGELCYRVPAHTALVVTWR